MMIGTLPKVTEISTITPLCPVRENNDMVRVTVVGGDDRGPQAETVLTTWKV
jgi:hypothetical protein